MKRNERLLVLLAAAIVVIAAVAWRGKVESVPAKESIAPIAETAAEPAKKASDGTRHNRALMYLLR